MAADGQPQRIVLAIVYVWHGDAAQNGRKEGAWSPQTVDAKRIVAAVFGCPFRMVNLARGQYVLVDVGQNIRADDGSHTLFLKGIVELLQGIFVKIHVIRVELHDESSATRVVSGKVPAATHAQIAAFGHDVYEARVVVFVHSLGGSVGGMTLGAVLNHEHVVFKARLLLQCTVDGIAYRANPVAHGNHH